jgi:cytochrome P450
MTTLLEPLELPAGFLLSALGLLWLIYCACVIIYRLCFSPLAKFPGPKLAAITGWYEAYFDLIHQGGGQFPFEIKRMHARYGPIVRINPDELHVADPDFYNVLYTTGAAYDKPVKFEARFGVPFSLMATASGQVHKVRRAAVSPLFAKARVRDTYSVLVQASLNRISQRLDEEWKGKQGSEGAVLNVLDMLKCFTADIIMDLMFTEPKNFWQAPGFHVDYLQAVDALARWGHITYHFGFVNQILNSLPDWLVERIFPPFRPVIELRRETKQLIAGVLAEKTAAAAAARSSGGKVETRSQHGKLFHELVFSDMLPPSELHIERLSQEGSFLIGAGFEATAWTMTVGAFYIVSDPAIHSRLKAELAAAIPDAASIPPWNQLERLPYLTAIIKECLRLAHAKVVRLPRQQNKLTQKTSTPWVYKQWTIPADAIVGMDLWTLHTDRRIWGPDADSFRPERWLGDPRGPDGTTPLTRYLLGFGKGTRGCAGLHLAYCEMYLGFATLFRRHEFSLFETTERDVQFCAEFMKSVPQQGSKGVRFLVN